VDRRADAIAAALDEGGGDVAFVQAPGRVNLIGEHTDYNGGWVLPMALDLDCLVGFRRREDGAVRVTSLDAPGEIAPWVDALVTELAAEGRAPAGLDAVVASTVPMGAGLASSGALSIALGLALCRVAGLELEPAVLAEACRRAEERATGVPCGIMDQVVGVLGAPREPLLVDCRDVTVERVSLPAHAVVVVADSGVRRSLSDGRYAERREACEAAAARLGVGTLRDASAADVADDPVARHVVSENERVHRMVAALRSGDVEAAGAVLTEGHRSLRDDFAVSTPELDALAERLCSQGAYGARLTGAGFGGCVVALGGPELSERVAGDPSVVSVQ
jgi:galactokinase